MKAINYLLITSFLLIFSFFLNSCEEDSVVVVPENKQPPVVVDTTKKSADVVTLKANYFVSTTGLDSNPGTSDKPFKTIEKAFSLCTTGTELIYVRGGVYKVQNTSQYYGFKLSGRNGKDANNKIKIWAYPGERVVLDCSSMKANDDGIVGLRIESSYVHIKGFDIVNMPQNVGPNGFGFYNVGVLVKANYVTLENCTSHDNGGTGINIGGTSTGTYLRNCDAYNNYDPYTYLNDQAWPGGNADGFHVTVSGPDTKHTLIGCRSWNNADDGYDCYGTDGYITMDSCWAFHNGYLANNTASKGDGSGIKLGVTGQYNVLKKNITHCVAAFNRMEGITQNRGYVVMNISNNTAYGNGSSQFDFPSKLSGTQISLTKNISVGQIYAPHPIQTNNSWNLSVIANADDFVSTDQALLKAARQTNGNLPVNSIFRLKANSDLKGLGAF